MKVEIWSDVVCPFCYIGKRKFENALNTFGNKEGVEVVWRSFQLDPTTKPEPGKSVAQSLAEKKGWTPEQVVQINAQVNKMAVEVGLNYQMDKAVIANTWDAHRLIHLAAKNGLQDAAEERLFAAYFTEGKDIGNLETLVQLGTEIGLSDQEVKEALQSDAYNMDVKADIAEASQVGVSGVPFFVFNDKYAVSGAQSSKVFTDVLNKVWEEENPAAVENNTNGMCTTDGICN